ncbi:MAG: hypothetical protein ACREMV_13495 [Gemmatimonadales bacterium]
MVRMLVWCLDRRGLALESTLLVLVLMSFLMIVAYAGVVTTIRTSDVDYRNTRVTYAAEAGAEGVLAQLHNRIQDGVLSDADLAALAAPPIAGFAIDSFWAAKVGGVVTETITDGPFVGLYSLTQRVQVYAGAGDGTGHRSAALVDVKAQAIPIFQFAVFWEGDLEDYAAAHKDIVGRVHANGNMYLRAADLHFHDPLTTPGLVRRDPKLAHDGPGNVYVYNAAGAPVLLDFDSETHPDPAAFRARSDASFDGRLKTGAYGVDSLRLPLPAGMPMSELIRPREDSDSDLERTTKLAWKATMYVTVDFDDIKQKKHVCGGTSNNKHPTITVVRFDGGPVPGSVDKCNIFDFKFDAFGDKHEQRWVDALTVQLHQLRVWATTGAGASGPKPTVIYVEIRGPTGPMVPDPQTDPRDDNAGGQPFPALRVKNGATLPGPLTIGSEYPLYVQGDYNTTAKQPASLFGDTYTFLSSSYPDSGAAIPDKPTGTNVTHYFSIVTGTGEGYVGCWHHTTGCSAPPYGAAGWFRSLETMAGRTFTFRGSFVSLWAPVRATIYGNFPGTNYYTPPIRDTRFDTDLLDPAKLPPATPVVGHVIHTGFRPVY